MKSKKSARVVADKAVSDVLQDLFTGTEHSIWDQLTKFTDSGYNDVVDALAAERGTPQECRQRTAKLAALYEEIIDGIKDPALAKKVGDFNASMEWEESLAGEAGFLLGLRIGAKLAGGVR